MEPGNNYINILLQALTGNEHMFGAILSGKANSGTKPSYRPPLEGMLLDHFPSEKNKQGIQALAIIGTLYLSVLHAGFPKETFRTAITYLREETSLLAFNCNHYDKLYARLCNEPQVTLKLLCGINKFHDVTLKKEDIFEAFDFRTNAL